MKATVGPVTVRYITLKGSRKSSNPESSFVGQPTTVTLMPGLSIFKLLITKTRKDPRAKVQRLYFFEVHLTVGARRATHRASARVPSTAIERTRQPVCPVETANCLRRILVLRYLPLYLSVSLPILPYLLSGFRLSFLGFAFTCTPPPPPTPPIPRQSITYLASWRRATIATFTYPPAPFATEVSPRT